MSCSESTIHNPLITIHRIPMSDQTTYDWTFRDRTGRVHSRVTRGPQTIDEMVVAARRLLHEQTLQAIDQGSDDPGLQLLEVTQGQPADALFGQPLRPGAKPVDLGEFARAVNQ
jgi:hypothetical protein